MEKDILTTKTGDSESMNEKFDPNEETQTVYKENLWPAKPEVPKGYTYKGKSKMMTYAIDKIKSALKKGV